MLLEQEKMKIFAQYQLGDNVFAKLEAWILIPQINCEVLWTTKAISLSDELYD